MQGIEPSNLELLEGALESFMKPYSDVLWISEDHRAMGPLKILDDMMNALDSKDDDVRQRGFLATQALMVIGLKVAWNYTTTVGAMAKAGR